MDWLMPLLTDTDSIGHILLVYSVVIAVGMALGRIKVFGISLGVTFVLFVALAVSYAGITVNGTVLNFLRDFGLILFPAAQFAHPVGGGLKHSPDDCALSGFARYRDAASDFGCSLRRGYQYARTRCNAGSARYVGLQR